MTMNTTARFILADNQDVTRKGVGVYIQLLFPESDIVEAPDKKELLNRLVENDKCVVVLDYTLFDINGVDSFLAMVHRFANCRWILFSNELSDDFICRIGIERSVSMILKDNSGDEISSALRCAVAGDRFLCHQISNLLIMGPDRPEVHSVLTPSEVEILKLVARGMSAKEIAAERVSSIHTIITHKKNIFRKLDVNNVYEATRYALRAGLIEMAEYYI